MLKEKIDPTEYVSHRPFYIALTTQNKENELEKKRIGNKPKKLNELYYELIRLHKLPNCSKRDAAEKLKQEEQEIQERFDFEQERVEKLNDYYLHNLVDKETSVLNPSMYSESHKAWDTAIDYNSFEPIYERTLEPMKPDTNDPVEVAEMLFGVPRAQVRTDPTDVSKLNTKQSVPQFGTLQSSSENKENLPINGINGYSEQKDTIVRENSLKNVQDSILTSALADSMRVNGRKLKNQPYTSFTKFPSLHGKEGLPAVVFHVIASLKEKLLVFGGGYTDLIDNVDFEEYKRIKVQHREYPVPMDESIMNNPFFIPNGDVYIMNSFTNRVEKPKLYGDVPPPLIKPSLAAINNRYMFYYGGFELITEEVQDVDASEDSDTIYLKKHIKMNKDCWIFDSVQTKFKKVKLVTKPGCEHFLEGRFSNALFSTSNMALKSESVLNFDKIKMDAVEKDVFDTERKEIDYELEAFVVKLFVFGGFYYDEKTDKYSSLNSYFEIQLKALVLNYDSCLVFEDEVIASELNDKSEEIPPARGFFAACICDNEFFSKRAVLEPVQSGTIVDSDVIQDARKQIQMPMATVSVLIQGGCNTDNEMIADLWKFDFKLRRWEKLPMYANEFNDDLSPRDELIEASYSRVSHGMVIMGKHLVFAGGLDQTVDPKLTFTSDLRDAHDIAEDLIEKSNYNSLRMILIDLTTMRFIFIKYEAILMDYLSFDDFLGSSELAQKVPVATLKDMAEGAMKLAYSGDYDIDTVKRLFFLAGTTKLLSLHLCVSGGSICISEGKALCCGGMYRCPVDLIQVFSGGNDDVVQLMTMGFPMRIVIQYESPLHSSTTIQEYSR